MSFENGNKLWALSERPTGKPRLFEGPEQLLTAVLAYFEWAAANPLQENVVGWYQGKATDHTVVHERAFSIRGLCVHANCSVQMWNQWKRQREDLAAVQEWAENVMFEQKFAGAAAGLFNANIIARDLGLAESLDHRGKDGAPLQPTQIVFAPAGLPVPGNTEPSED